MSDSGAGLVSVVLPCYQAERYLAEALDSILAQTYDDLEVVALDDGSTDGTRDILEGFAARDPRVKILVNETNLGLIRTLNRGVGEAVGAFIARMDADDVARPDRFEVQTRWLREHREVGAVGSSVVLVDPDGVPRGAMPARALAPGAVRFMATFATPLAHPTLLARAPVLKRHPYSLEPRALHTEDYELFARLVAAGVRLANVPEPLLERRIHPGSVSLRYEELQKENFATCARAHLWDALGLEPEGGAHRVLVNRMTPATTPTDLRVGLGWVGRLERRFLVAEPEAASEIRGLAHEQRIDILVQALRRCRPVTRAAALALLPRYAGSFLSRRGRAYLSTKLV